jgi:hypothetical protein
MWTLLLATALAGDGSVKTTSAAATTAATAFAPTTLTKVGTATCGRSSFEVRCGKIAGKQTCAQYDAKGNKLAETAIIAVQPSGGFKATWTKTADSTYCEDWSID